MLGPRLISISPRDPPEPTAAQLTAAKAFAGITDTTRDVYLTAILHDALRAIERHCGCFFSERTVTERILCPDTGPMLVLKHAPVVSITSVTEDDTLVDATDYQIDDYGTIWHKTNSTWGDEIVVVYTAGHVVDTTRVLAALGAILQQADAEAQGQGAIAKESLVDVGSVEYARSNSSSGSQAFGGALPPAVGLLLSSYVRRV